jgi:hypothetical protein
MRIRQLLCVLAATLVTGGCFQSTTLVKIKADGSGTIEQRTIMTAAALAQLRQLAGSFGNTDKKIDLFSEDQARKVADQMGEGVTFVSSTPISTSDGEGRTTVYAFRDITRIHMSDAAKTSLAGTGTGARSGGPDVTIGFERTAAGTSMLTVHMPGEDLKSALESQGVDTPKEVKPSDLAMMREMFSGLRIGIQVEPEGRLIRTNSPYVNGQTVTLFAVDLDEFLKDAAVLNRLSGTAGTKEDMLAALKNVPGLKLTLDDITVEFAAR